MGQVTAGRAMGWKAGCGPFSQQGRLQENAVFTSYRELHVRSFSFFNSRRIHD